MRRLQAHLQQDVQEMARVMMSALEDSFKDTSAASLVHQVFTGTLSNQVACVYVLQELNGFMRVDG